MPISNELANICLLVASVVSGQLREAPDWVSADLPDQLRLVLDGLGGVLPLERGWRTITNQLCSTKNLRALRDVAAHECTALEATR